jgi:hypothetical protein
MLFHLLHKDSFDPGIVNSSFLLDIIDQVLGCGYIERPAFVAVVKLIGGGDVAVESDLVG